MPAICISDREFFIPHPTAQMTFDSIVNVCRFVTSYHCLLQSHWGRVYDGSNRDQSLTKSMSNHANIPSSCHPTRIRKPALCSLSIYPDPREAGVRTPPPSRMANEPRSSTFIREPRSSARVDAASAASMAQQVKTSTSTSMTPTAVASAPPSLRSASATAFHSTDHFSPSWTVGPGPICGAKYWMSHRRGGNMMMKATAVESPRNWSHPAIMLSALV